MIQSELESRNLNEKDTIIGIAASGSTPFVVSGLQYGKKQGALTIAISNNEQTEVSAISDIGIEAVVGPEVIRGSTRLKAGSAQKMMINMISTAVMVRLGKVYSNEMVDMKLINQKLVQRGAGIIQTVAGIPEEDAFDLLKKSQCQLKEALFMALTDASQEEAVRCLKEADGHVKKAVTLFLGKHIK